MLRARLCVGILLLLTAFTSGLLRCRLPAAGGLRMSFLSGLFGGGGQSSSGTSKTMVIPGDFQDTAPAWAEIDRLLREKEPSAERTEYELRKNHARGGSSHKANLRLFDAPDGFTPTVTLYRDQAAWCPYCEKVWLQLEEKRIPYAIKKQPLSCYGDKSPDFFRVSPSGQLPVAEINGRIVSESNVIINTLEEEFPQNKPLLPPAGSKESARVQPLLRLERQLFSSWFSWLTSRAAGPGAAQEMDSLFKKVDAELAAGGGPYFLGAELSLVDIMFTPFLERMAASLPYFKGFECRSSKYPHLLKWYEAMETRPAYLGIKSDYYTHTHDLPPQIGGCHFNAESAPFRAEIDGGAWSVNKSAEDCLEPMLPLDAPTAKRDAVRQFVDNKDNVVAFACRGVGSVGQPRVRAELADPKAKANLDFVPPVDSAFRHILYAMLQTDSQAVPPPPAASLPESLKEDVEKCLVYLRDRVGVPRDMTVHGARQLRASINQFIDHNCR